MSHPLDRSLGNVARALRAGKVSAAELADEALRRHASRRPSLEAYKLLEPDRVRASARRADRILREAGSQAPPLCGIPVSVKDLYGMNGLPTYAGTRRRLPERWSRDAWLVARLREQGAVFMGKTHTVELAFGAVGINPHWGTPRNPWDDRVHRIPGGSSAGAGVSLGEGSALVALGTDTGGSIRIPAAMTGTVGQKLTQGRWPTEGVVPLSTTLDTVGALTRTVADAAYFFRAIEGGTPPASPPLELEGPGTGGTGNAPRRRTQAPPHPIRFAVPAGEIWASCTEPIARALDEALELLEVEAGWRRLPRRGELLDRAGALYMEGGIAAAECRAFLENELPGWLEILHPTVGRRLEGAPTLSSKRYASAQARRGSLAEEARDLFDGVDLLVLPGATFTPPPVADLEPLDRYLAVNGAALQPTCPASALGLCALSLPAGLDNEGMPVGLQLVAPGGSDASLLRWSLDAEAALGVRWEIPVGPAPRPWEAQARNDDPRDAGGMVEEA